MKSQEVRRTVATSSWRLTAWGRAARSMSIACVSRPRLGGVTCSLLVALSGVLGAALTQQEPLATIPSTVDVDPKRAAVGERLFHDVRVSRGSTHSCATCHPLDRGGMDGLPVAKRHDGVWHHRNTPTIFNVGLNATFNWDGVVNTLEDHTERVLRTFMHVTWPELLARLRAEASYVSQFAAAYPEGVTRTSVLNAMTTFERSLLTAGSRFDRYLLGEQDALTAREKQGYQLFKFYGCVSCHQGVNVGGNMYQRFGVFEYIPSGRITERDEGRFLVTKAPRDRHVFRVPSLRNVAVTAPYFHDGRARTLETAVKTMGRAQLGRELTADEVAVLVEFLHTLTGEYRGRPLRVSPPEAQ
jgi:cytochrome c peroxidase